MWALVIVGKPRNMEDFYRGIAALTIARVNHVDANVIINGEIMLKNYPKNKYFDHVVLKVNVPLDIRGLLDYGKPIMIVEDSTSKRRLISRRNELSSIKADIEFEFMYVKPVSSNKLILSLQRNQENGFYVLEVGV